MRISAQNDLHSSLLVGLKMNDKNKQTENIETGSTSKPGGSAASTLPVVTPVLCISGEAVDIRGHPSNTKCSERSNKVGIPKFGSGRVVHHDPSTTKERKSLPSTSRKGAQPSGAKAVNHGLPNAGGGPLPSTSKNIKPSKYRYKERRDAARILKNSGDSLGSEGNSKLAARIQWAKNILSKTSCDSTSKRDRSMEGTTPEPKRPRVQNTSTPQNPKSYSDALKDKIVIAIIDRSDIDGTISADQWTLIKVKLSSGFISIMKDNPGPPPSTYDGGWHQGHVKLIVCEDQRSCDLYKLAVSRLGEIWPGAKLEVVAKEDIPSRPRARAWIPVEPSDVDEILHIIKVSNPNLPTHDWKVAKLEEPKGLYRSAIIVVNKDTLAPLAQAKGMFRYGFEIIGLRIYKKDELDAEGVPPQPLQPLEAAPVVEDAAASVTFPSMEDDGSSSSLNKVQSSQNVDSLTDMETEDSSTGPLNEDELLNSSSELEDDITVVEVDLPDCSKNAAASTD